MKKNLRYLLTMAFVVVWMPSVAKNVSRSEALDKARYFMESVISGGEVNASRRVAAHPEFKQVVLDGMQADDECFYIYNCTTTPAFVIVSGESRTREILAYSFESTFDVCNIAPSVMSLIDGYKKQIALVKDTPSYAPSPISSGATDGKVIETAHWNQSYHFWWSQCPLYGDKQCHAGCAAAAMAIAMRHYSWPETGIGSNSYTFGKLKVEQNADFNTTYNWNLPMGNEDDDGWTASAQDDVAKILHHAGIAAEVSYSPNGTGGSMDEAFGALIRNFKYNKYMKHEIRSNYTDEEWKAMLKKEIDEDRIIIYDGMHSGGTPGHMFICDGYDATGLFHFNFGWSGYYNGFFSLDNIIPISGYDFSYYQSAIIDIQPESMPPSEHNYDIMMVATGDGTRGLKMEKTGSTEDAMELTFKAYYVQNVSCESFSGIVGVFICDSNGGIKQELCRKQIELKQQQCYWYQRSCWDGDTHTAWIEHEPFISFTASVQPSDEFKKSDRIWVKFSTDGEDWYSLYGISEDVCSLPLPVELLKTEIKPGDSNVDDNVNVVDLAAIVHHILGKTPERFNEGAADIDGDGNVTEADLTAILQLILYGAVDAEKNR